MSQYPGVGWVDGPNGGTPLDAAELDVMDQGIADEDLRNPASPASLAAAALYGHDVRAWAPYTQYAAGQAVVSPTTGDVVSAATAHTSSASYSGLVSAGGNWNPSTSALANAPVFGAAGYDERTLPAFTRYTGNPVLTLANQNLAAGKTGATSITWPYVVNVGVIPGLSPINKFYMYYTTDHDTGYGGVYLATGPTPYGPWIGQGLVFQNTGTPNSQTEDVSVIWNEDESLFFMYVKVLTAAGDMQTNLVTSPDGVTWTEQGAAVFKPGSNNNPGNGQTAYMRPFKIGHQWHAHIMIGGGAIPFFDVAHSDDGRVWQLEGRALAYGADQLVDVPGATTPIAQNNMLILWNSGDVIWWRGQWMWIGILSDYSYANGTKNSRIAYAPISSDFRSLLGRPKYLLQPPTGANESYNIRAVHSHVYQGRIFLTYQCDSNFNLAVSQ
jgi:hypothetical protein